jgi:hypothetical protein
VHLCVCGEDWEAEYESDAVVDPVCPNCGRCCEVLSPKGKAARESITSKVRF